MILDYHWEEGFHNFRWRKSLFPDPDALLKDLKALGLRLGLIFTPFVNNRNLGLQKWALNLLNRSVPRGHQGDDERALPEYEEARAQGYLAHENASWWFGQGGMLDFTNPEAARWWNAKLLPLYQKGVAFFKNDDGEYLPDDARSHLGLDGREYHNLYGLFYGKALYEGMAKLDDRRPLIYARQPWAGSQRYPAIFLGDQKPNFECIRRTMRAGLNMALAGFSYWTADVFGLDGKTTPETHMRYAQWALLVPVARYFSRPADVDDTRFPWSHDAQVEANFRAYTELRYRLLPYYYALAWEAHRTGLPILRPLVLEFPDDPAVADICDQVLLGNGLMLAPVVEAGATHRRVVLPPGVWHDFWSSATYQGGQEIDYPAPLDRLPILIRGGTVLPMGPVLQHIPDEHRFDEVQFHVWPPYPADGVLYDDDGTTRAYERGAWSMLRVSARQEGPSLVVEVGAVEGGFPGEVDGRRVELVLHRVAAPARVRVNGQDAAWAYNSAEGCVVIPLRCPARQALRVEVLQPVCPPGA